MATLQLKIDEPETLQNVEQMLDNNKLGIIIISSADDSIGVGTLLQYPIDEVEIITHDEDGWWITLKNGDSELEAYDMLIV